MLEAELAGVAEAIGNLTERGAIDPVVKATLVLSESGFISVSDAIAYGEIKDDSLTGALNILIIVFFQLPNEFNKNFRKAKGPLWWRGIFNRRCYTIR